jgi:hypothetical protein
MTLHDADSSSRSRLRGCDGMPGRALAAALALGFAACPSATRVPDDPPTHATAEPGPAVVQPPTPCERLLAPHRAVTAGVDADSWMRRAPMGQCVPARGGVWALVVEATRPSGLARWGLHWMSDQGVEARLVPESGTGACDDDFECNFDDYGVLAFEPLRLTDVDRDGVEELYLGAVFSANEGVYSATHGFYEVAGEPAAPQIARVPDLPALGGHVLEGIADVDADGGVDLLTHGPYVGFVEHLCSGFSFRVQGPMFLLHQQADGSWRWDDEVAMAHAAAECGSAQMEESSLLQVACDRIRGKTAAKTIAPLRCRPWRQGEDPCADEPPAGVCEEHALLMAWARAVPPLVLGRPAKNP